MEQWLMNVIEEIEVSQDILAIKKVLVEVKRKLGFDSVLYAIELPSGFSSTTLVTTDYPHEWIDLYKTSNFEKIDPVLAHCSNSQTPYCWDRILDTKNDTLIEFIMQSCSYGLVGGISVGLHQRTGEVAIFSVGKDSLVESGGFEFSYVSGAMIILHPHLYEAFSRLTSFNDFEKILKLLSKTDLECLVWFSEGKTTEEIGEILGVDTPKVVVRIQQVMKKLEVDNRAEAVAKAILLGIVCPEYGVDETARTYYF